jgi:hypothetical protein
LQHLQAQVKSYLVEVFEKGLRVHSFEFGESGLEVRQIFFIKIHVRAFIHCAGVGVPWNWKILKI